jgi:hypothetical protein
MSRHIDLFDWVMLSVEFLVLAIIAYDSFGSFLHKRKAARLLAIGLPFLKQGKSLSANPPNPISDIESVSALG